MAHITTTNNLLEYELLTGQPDVYGFSTTRWGGCSEGDYASLNCTPYTGDNEEHVKQNRELLCAQLPQRPHELVIPYQTHGKRILTIDKAYEQANAEERNRQLQGIDALITGLEGYCLCVSTADCIPVLLHDRKHQAIAAVHAGWRGTVNSILGHTLKEMEARYGTKGTDLTACIGPGISLSAFEVGDEVYEEFRKAGFPMEYIALWKPETHKYHIDLWAANRLQLLEFGIPKRQIETAGICTYAHYQKFFSARRMGICSGRILTGIMLLTTQQKTKSSTT